MTWLRTALGRIIEFLPDLLAGVIILAIGWLIGRVLARVVIPILHRTGFDRLLARHKIIRSSPDTRAGSRGAGEAIFWVVLLAALMQATRAWHLDFLATGLAHVLAYVPHLLAAALIFGVTLIFADWVRSRVGPTDERRASLVPGAIRAGILAFGAFVALRELLIAPQIVTIAFTLVLGAIAVATALSVGLGTRSVAERMARDWYEHKASSKPRADEPTDTAHPVH